MSHVEKHNLLGNEMHGGCTGRTTHDALHTQNLTYNISLKSKTDLTSISLDATKCFDRIFPNVATIALSRLGLPLNVGISIAKTIEEMKHKVCTAGGTSTQQIGDTKNSMWSGVCQGSAAAGPSWIALESMMLKVMETKIEGTKVQCPKRELTYQNTIVGYIDDTNINSSYMHKEATMEELTVDLNIFFLIRGFSITNLDLPNGIVGLGEPY